MRDFSEDAIAPSSGLKKESTLSVSPAARLYQNPTVWSRDCRLPNDKGKVEMNGKWQAMAHGSALNSGAARSASRNRQSAVFP
jgi:hypothetical protein